MLTITTLLRLRLRRSVEIRNDAFRSHPASRLPGLDVQDIHGVDIFEGTALGLVDKEEDDQHGSKAAAGEDVAVVEVDGAGDEWSEEGDEEVPGPVGGSSDTHACGTVAEGVHLCE